MLINISNHPSIYWSEEQLSVANKIWGGVYDIALPYISPQLDGKDVLHKAEIDVESYISIIQQYDIPSAFHVMGESVYCFHVVKLLKEAGYTIVASTSERCVEYDRDNKISHFEFVKFREY